MKVKEDCEGGRKGRREKDEKKKRKRTRKRKRKEEIGREKKK